jgi:S-adenosylmethionine synthetase
VTKKASSDHLIVRVPVLYGYTEENGFKESAINFVYELIKDGNSVKLDNVQTRFPTNCIDVARFCMNLLLKRFLVIIY